MNRKVEIPLGLGVDRHNRVPQPEGPMLRSLRNLVLDDQNELVLRKAMEWRQDILVGSSDTGGVTNANGIGVTSLPAGASDCRQPLCLWLPQLGEGASAPGGRQLTCVLRGTGRDLLLVTDDATTAVRMPAHPRRPQAAVWGGALWVACGDAVPVPTYNTAGMPPTGLVRVARYVDGNGVGRYNVFSGMGVDMDGDGAWSLLVLGGAAGEQQYRDFAVGMRPRVIGTYRGRMVLANFPPDAYGNTRRNGILFSDFLPAPNQLFNPVPSVSNIPVPIFGRETDATNHVDPFTTRLGLIGDDGEEIVGVKELSLMQLGSMNQSALLILKDRSVWLMTGEYLSTPDVGSVQGDSVPVRQPIPDGCASFETVAVTPWGIIWVGHDDVYFMHNGGGAPIPIGRRIAKQLKNTPFDLQYLWHGVYHEGYYRLAIMAPGQTQDDPVAMEEEWRLDLRYGPPHNWEQARWFGPQVFQPQATPIGQAGDMYRGTFIQAVEERSSFKKELFAFQLGFSGDQDRYCYVLAGLDGEETKDWACEFSSVQFRPVGTSELGLAVGEKRIISAAGWKYGRRVKVKTAGDSGSGEPTWVDDPSVDVTDGTVVWDTMGRIAVPGNFNDLTTNDGEDAVPTSRGNEIVPLFRSMEFPADQPNRDVQFRGLEVGASGKDAVTWALQGLKDQLGQGSLIEYQSSQGNFVLGVTALDTRINDPMKPLSMWVDNTAAAASLAVGKFVAFTLAQYPYFNITPDELSFAFNISPTAGAAPTSILKATLDPTSMGYGTSYLKTVLDAVCTAMNAALVTYNIGGGNTFTHNLTTSPSTCPVKPTITLGNSGGTWQWYPYSFTDAISQLPVADYGIPSLWLKLGFTAQGAAWGLGTYSRTVVAPYSPWQRNVPKLRVASLTAVLRSFKRGPT